MSKNMMWYVWMLTYLHRNVIIVRGASYHLLGSRISQDSKIRFWLQVRSYISNWQFRKSEHFSKLCFPPFNAMVYDMSGQTMFDGDFPLVNPVFYKKILHLNIFGALWAACSAICLEQHCAHVILVKEWRLHVKTPLLHEVARQEDVSRQVIHSSYRFRLSGALCVYFLLGGNAKSHA